ncbi:hypothetical protein KM043_010804 [Ampulex compressa]|nr:hypothetical protein KM043_010804 [Ampulex compressa]
MALYWNFRTRFSEDFSRHVASGDLLERSTNVGKREEMIELLKSRPDFRISLLPILVLKKALDAGNTKREENVCSILLPFSPKSSFPLTKARFPGRRRRS